MGARLAGVLVAIGVCAGLLAGVASAQPQSTAVNAAAPRLLVGSDGHGVRVDRRDGFRFVYTTSAKARYAQIAGRHVDISCDQLRRLSGGLIVDTGGGGTEVKASAHRAPIASGYIGAADVCYLGTLLPQSREQVVAVVATSRRGALFLDQQADARRVGELVLSLGLLTAGQEQRLLGALGGVALRSEHAVPPGHQVGAYFHGSHAYAAQRDRAGKLLFLRADGDVVSTDLFGFYTDPSLSGIGPYVGQQGPVD